MKGDDIDAAKLRAAQSMADAIKATLQASEHNLSEPLGQLEDARTEWEILQ